MFGINDTLSSALTLFTTSSPEAVLDVPPDFDWRKGEINGQSRNTVSSSLTGQTSISNPLYDWSSMGSPALRDHMPRPSSAFTYASGGQVSTPSGYACVPDRSGVQFRPITPLSPTLHTPTPRAPASLQFERPSSSISTRTFATATLPSPSPASYMTAQSTPSSSTSFASFSPIAPPSMTPAPPPAYGHYPGPTSSILGQPNGLLPSPLTHEARKSPHYLDQKPAPYDIPSQDPPRKEVNASDKARPLFHPESSPSVDESPKATRYLSSQPAQKRKAPPAWNESPPKQRRRTTKQEVIEVESDSEDSEEYEGMELFDTGYQSSVEDSKASIKSRSPSKTTASRKNKAQRRKSPLKYVRDAVKDEDSDEETGNPVEDLVKVKEEPVKEEPVKEEPVKGKSRTKPAVKRVPFGTPWTGPHGGELKLNAKAPRPEGWADGLYRWSYSTDRPVSAAGTDRMSGDVHFCPSIRSLADEDEPFTSWVAKADSKGIRWVEFTAGQPHPQFKGWVLQEAKLPKSPPRWVKEATFKAKY